METLKAQIERTNSEHQMLDLERQRVIESLQSQLLASHPHHSHPAGDTGEAAQAHDAQGSQARSGDGRRRVLPPPVSPEGHGVGGGVESPDRSEDSSVVPTPAGGAGERFMVDHAELEAARKMVEVLRGELAETRRMQQQQVRACVLACLGLGLVFFAGACLRKRRVALPTRPDTTPDPTRPNTTARMDTQQQQQQEREREGERERARREASLEQRADGLVRQLQQQTEELQSQSKASAQHGAAIKRHEAAAAKLAHQVVLVHLLDVHVCGLLRRDLRACIPSRIRVHACVLALCVCVCVML